MTSEERTAHQKRLNQIANTSDPFIDNEWGGLTTDAPAPRYKNSEDFGGISTGLPKGTSNKDLMRDPEIIAELERRDPKFKQQQDAKRIREVAQAFMHQTKDYVPSEANFEEILKWLRLNILQDKTLNLDDVEDACYAAGKWDIETLKTAFAALKARGKMELPPDTYKELTRDEHLSVVAKIRRGQAAEAISEYLQFSLPNKAIQHLPVEAIASEYPTLVYRCVWYVWRTINSHLPVDELNDFQKSMRHLVLPTISLINEAWGARIERELLRLDKPAPVPAPTPEPEAPRELTEVEINALPEAELDRLIVEQRKRERARIFGR